MLPSALAPTDSALDSQRRRRLGEALGLKAMRHTGSVRIPEVIGYGDGATSGSFLVMELLNLGGRADAAEFGRAMARMHLAEPLAPEARAGKFGFDVPNTIGGTAQPNAWCDDWVTFSASSASATRCGSHRTAVSASSGTGCSTRPTG